MPILTATEVTTLVNISATAGTITAKNMIPTIQDRISMLTNNYFVTELQFVSTATFNNSARSIVIDSGEFEEYGFAAGDDIYIYNSYRNDGYKQIESISGATAILTSADTAIAELSGKSIIFSVCKWPLDVKRVAALMIKYDCDERESVGAHVRSHSLGPFSETFSYASGGGADDMFGYPIKITDPLSNYRIARLM